MSPQYTVDCCSPPPPPPFVGCPCDNWAGAGTSITLAITNSTVTFHWADLGSSSSTSYSGSCSFLGGFAGTFDLPVTFPGVYQYFLLADGIDLVCGGIGMQVQCLECGSVGLYFTCVEQDDDDPPFNSYIFGFAILDWPTGPFILSGHIDTTDDATDIYNECHPTGGFDFKLTGNGFGPCHHIPPCPPGG